MHETQYYLLHKDGFSDFISRLAKVQTLAAPVKRGEKNYAFELVTSADAVSLHYIPTILPPKKYFLPQREVLLEFDTGRGLHAEPVGVAGPMTIFGVHTCDLAGIQCLNMVFSVRPRDHNYLIRKRKITIIGLECNDYCDEHANCALVSANLPSGGYDLFFTDLGGYFIVHVNTQAGDDIIDTIKQFRPAGKADLRDLAALRERKKAVFANEVDIDQRHLPSLFDASFDSPVWKDLDERCLACGNCTQVCPTCYCFDIRDELNPDMTTGVRCRVWDSCQTEPFARVAGGENFRKSRLARQRHRYYRKFSYPVQKFSRFFCTGCGRCSRTCMAGIRLKETLTSLISQAGEGPWKR